MANIKKRIEGLLSKISTNADKGYVQDATEMVLDMIKDCANYVDAVSVMVSKRSHLAGAASGEEFRREITEADKHRTIVHNSVIASVDSVNYLCQSLGLEPLYAGGRERRQYGDFAFEVTKDYFTDRQ